MSGHIVSNRIFGSSIFHFGEYRLGGLPQLCLKGNTYCTVLFTLSVEEDMAGELTSVIFSGERPSGTKEGEPSLVGASLEAISLTSLLVASLEAISLKGAGVSLHSILHGSSSVGSTTRGHSSVNLI